MQEPTFLILTALAAGPQHGYGMITDVREISAGRVVLRAGTLYAALDRLQAEGLIEGDREEVVDGRVRRYYRLTDSGGARLAAEAERLRRHAEAASTRLRARLAGGALFRHGITGGAPLLRDLTGGAPSGRGLAGGTA
ncbi:helix-turn-helix transcriptional regulator [Planomonospora sp. ID91781]|uniref:PadR family transcriptional regulator n=1 Tax=Planomonospora sphaerica TaxID=161355 RepID=A0A171BW44_9ACTN|nr:MULTISPECIES: helix-turn-helix transcriptional regulator [Planomonospora]MBG0824004.1 helix-turn-helix transcriptional regulator [Planomonospora sp. ID91781]GAT65669.1 padR family transcriptional regulator [Planomonospora sphaerica]